MKRCSKGTSCKGACIEKSDQCRATLSPKLGEGLNDLGSLFLKQVEEGGKKPPSLPHVKTIREPSPEVKRLIKALELGPQTQREIGNSFPVLKREAERQLAELRAKLDLTVDEADRARRLESSLLNAWEKHTSAQRHNLYERQEAREFDYEFKPTDKYGKSYDWSQSYSSGAKSLGEGSFGSVMAPKSPPPIVVKRGEVSEEEINILNKLSGKGIAPDLLSAEIDKSITMAKEGSTNFYAGRVAMSRIEGKAAEDFDSYTDKVGNTTVGDAYFYLRKRLHENGIAHNDAHIQNVIINDKGVARFIDFGMSQADPRAAFSEAIGVLAAARNFLPSGAVLSQPLSEDSGDRQGRRFSQFSLPRNELLKGGTGTNLERIVKNRIKVYAELKKMGLTTDEIAKIVVTPLHQPLSSYNFGAWGKVSKEDAMKLISMLYEGVK